MDSRRRNIACNQSGALMLTEAEQALAILGTIFLVTRFEDSNEVWLVEKFFTPSSAEHQCVHYRLVRRVEWDPDWPTYKGFVVMKAQTRDNGPPEPGKLVWRIA